MGSVSSNKSVLFVTWDGPQVDYLEGLFLPVFEGLKEYGFRFHIAQFTWAEEAQIERTRATCAKRDMPYEGIKIWRRPKGPASVLSALRGGQFIKRLARQRGIDIVMPRSIMPALAVLSAGNWQGTDLIFDADGLAIDERVDFGGLSSQSLTYRIMRDAEAQMVRKAKGVLVRSRIASEVLIHRAGAGTDASKFHVVSNGRNKDVFHPQNGELRLQVRERLGIAADAPVIVYVGSLGSQYCIDEMLSFFSHVLSRRPDTRLLVLSSSSQELMEKARTFSISGEAIIGTSVEPARVPEYLACADVGLALRVPSFSMQGVAPIKLGEYLLCGVPVVATAGVGNTETISHREGFLLNTNGHEELKSAAAWFVDVVLTNRGAFREGCRDFGLAQFALEGTVISYLEALGG